jgi:group I intron endonuclease
MSVDEVCVVYGIISPNFKIYIGRTKNIDKRMKKHKEATNYNFKKSKKLYNCLRKYGWDNLNIITLEDKLTKEESYEREIDWIEAFDSFHNGLNSTPGGEYVGCGADNHQAKAVVLKNIDTKEEFEFDWIGSAAQCLSVHEARLWSNLSGRIRQIYNHDYSSRFVAQYKSNIQPWDLNISPKLRGIVVKDIDTKEEFQFDSIPIASKILNIHEDSIRLILRPNPTIKQVYSSMSGKRFVVKLRTDDTPWNLDITPIKFPVISYDKNDNFIARYDSIADAARLTNLASSSICSNVRHKLWFTGNLRWEYEDDAMRNAQNPRDTLQIRGGASKAVFTIIDGIKYVYSSGVDASRASSGVSRYYIERSAKSPTDSKIPDKNGNVWFYVDP